MDNTGLKRVEHILFVMLAVLGMIAVAGIMIMIGYEKEPEDAKEYHWEDGLSDSTIWLPDHCNIYSNIPEFEVTDMDGKVHSVTELEGKPAVLVFWASWCGDCEEQMPLMNDFSKLAKEKAEIQFIYINKTDGERETIESATSYFQENEINGELFFDEGLKAYEQLGLHNVPTMLFLDENGVITAWSPKPVTEIAHFEALLEKAIYGGTFATEEFITSQLMDEKGAVYSIYGTGNETLNSAVLSESVGAMLEYAVLSDHQELFDSILGFIEISMQPNGLMPWTVTNGEASSVNALIDDLRVYEAIYQANVKWGDYQEELVDYQSRLFDYGIYKGKFIDFYDGKSKSYGNRFTLCYGDLKTMNLLTETNSEFEEAYIEALKTVQNGQISDEFPLYYSWYNYDKDRYEKDDLNTAEAMVTLLHLAEMDLLPDNTLTWLKTQMAHSGVQARYSVDGNIVSGYEYDSTAVYALIAMIGVEVNDDVLINQAVRKMEKMRIDDTSKEFNGAFGMEDGTGITSFDQLIPLLAYLKISLIFS